MTKNRVAPEDGLNFVFETMSICKGSDVPDGWIVTNDFYDPSICDATSNPEIENVQTITKYADLEVGSTLNVCRYADVPAGWVSVNTYFAYNRCGHGTNPEYHNMRTIKRVGR